MDGSNWLLAGKDEKKVGAFSPSSTCDTNVWYVQTQKVHISLLLQKAKTYKLVSQIDYN